MFIENVSNLTNLVSNKDEGEYLSREVVMYWNFAKLLINALALKGLSARKAHLISKQQKEFAKLAILHALNTFQLILEDNASRESFSGTELYLHTMITYSSVFLLRVKARWQSARLHFNIDYAITSLERLARLLNEVKTGERHVASYIANGLVKTSAKFKALENMELNQTMGVDEMSYYSTLEKVAQDQRVPVEYRQIATFS
jgi:hypothetical protein